MVEPGKHVRNVLIVLLLAAGVWLLPGGGVAADTIGFLLSFILLGGLGFLGYRLYMENRETLLDLSDRLRLVLYGSAGLAVIAFVATRRMWDSGGVFILLWFALIAAASYGVYSVWRAYREY